MPQVWVTYVELGEHYALDAEAAREFVHKRRWDRRRSHDGFTRVKLPADVALSYMADFVSNAAVSEVCDLRARARATESAAQLPLKFRNQA